MSLFEMEDDKLLGSKSIVQGISPIRHSLKTEVVRCSFMKKARETEYIMDFLWKLHIWLRHLMGGWQYSLKRELGDNDGGVGKEPIMKTLRFS